MIHECQVNYVTIDKQGKDKNVKENYLVDNLECFTEVEEKLVEYGIGFTDFDVLAIKRSSAKEIANSKQNENDKIWLAEVMDVQINDDGEEKEIKYKIFLFAQTFDSAKAFISDYIKQGYDLTLVSLKLTKFVEVLA